MFIIERLIGVGIFFLVLMTVCYLLIKTDWNLRIILGAYVGVLALMGFLFKPYTTADLYRIYESIDMFSEYSLFAFIPKFVVTSTAPVSRILYWIIGKIGVYGLLPALAAVVTYSCIFYIVIRTAERCHIKRIDVALTVLFLMSTGAFMMVISNIRCMMAAAIVCFCFFRESIERNNSKWHILWYLIAAGLHNMGILAVLIRLCLLIPKLKLSRKQWLIAGGSALALLLMAWLIVPALMNKLMFKAKDYLFGETYSYVWEYISGGIVLLLEYWLLYISREFSPKWAERWRETRLFLLVCLLVACGLAWVFTFYIRFATFIAPILASPILMLSLRNNTGRRRRIVFAVSMLALFLACARGQLCSYKFFAFPWNA